MNVFYKPEDEERLVVLHTPLVVSIAFRYKPKPPNDHEDLISVGYIGLLKALRAYDPAKGTQFSTLASTVINREIVRELSKSNNKNYEALEMDVAEDDAEHLADYLPENLTEDEKKILYLRFYTGLTYEEIGAELGFTKQWANTKVMQIINKIRQSNDSKKTKNSSS